MTGVFVLLGGLTFAVVVLTVFGVLGQREERRGAREKSAR
jgi:hypothetical protein